MNKNMLKPLAIFVILFLFLVLVSRAVAQNWLAGSNSSGTVALISVEGVITGSGSAGGLLAMETGASSVAIADLLLQAKDDPDVKAVVLRINSPGGSAAASDEIYHAVRKCRQEKPVVASMGDVAASGGYYIASAAEQIYANGATLTGSIGVVFSMFNWEELAKNIGVKDMTVSAGDFKEIGSPWRSMTEDEYMMLETLVEDVHDQFIAAVADGRVNLSEDQVRELADGMVFTGSRARDAGLVDEIGGLHDAADKARSLAGVDSDTPLETYGESGGLLEQLFSLKSSGLIPDAGGSMSDPLFSIARSMYLSGVLTRIDLR